jgi:hypothetical protein
MPVSETELLKLWEEAARLPSSARAMRLAAFGDPEREGVLRGLPVGRRDAALCSLRGSIFGDSAPIEARCPVCREGVEFDIRMGPLVALGDGGRSTGSFTHDGRVRDFRVPTPADLASAGSPVALAVTCVPDASREDLADATFLEALSVAVIEADPLAEVVLNVVCGACGHVWDEVFDIGAYLWAELDRAARGVLGSVVMLARAFGWSEAEVLALSPARRAWYLAEVQA